MYAHQQLLNLIRRFSNYEKTQAGNSIMVGCTKETFDSFMKHPQLGPWVAKMFPKALELVQTWLDTPDEEKDQRINPFRLVVNTGAPVRVMFIYDAVDDRGQTCAEITDWETGESDILDLGVLEHYSEPKQGAIHTFENPKTNYIETLFLSNKVPTYDHILACWMTRHVIEIMESPAGREWGAELTRMSNQLLEIQREQPAE